MSLKVLLAETDWRFARQTSEFLESHAHLVVHQPQAGDVLSTVRHWRPDLVIICEELGGDGLLAELHAMDDRPAVLLVGWMDRYAGVWRAWQQGGDELLMKPIFKVEELHSAIVSALENAAAGVRHRPAAASA